MRGLVSLFAAAIVLAATAVGTASGEETDAGSSHGATYERACEAFDRGSYYTAFHDLLPFAARGDAKAQFAIGEMLRTGRGTRRNREESLIWYRRSAEQGFTAAQCNLGMALFKGWGTRADPQATIDWWLRAALNKNAHAMFNLGTVIARGRHVKRDFVIAYWWLMQASETGYVGADDVLATLRKVMTATQIARAQKLSADDATAFIRRPSPPVLTQQETPK
tara:strand:+ start:17972 stop:18637 length:666 start_codon:yes stop_codon:yes gene_type:complete